MIESDDDHINVWLAFSDLFVGVLVIITTLFVFYFSKVGIVKAVNEEQKMALNIVSEVMKSVGQASDLLGDTKTAVGFEIPLRADVLFKSGGYDDFLGDQVAREVLKKIGFTIKNQFDKLGENKRWLKIVVEGHTDAEPIQVGFARSKNVPTNWELSTRRATEVVKFLKTECGLEPNLYNVVAVGYGEFRPKTSNFDQNGIRRPRVEVALNRRIEIRIVPDYDYLMRFKADSARERP